MDREREIGCGYPSWMVDKDKKQMSEKASKRSTKKAKTPSANKSKGMVVIPYVAVTSEKISSIFKKHQISAAIEPHTTIKNVVIHPKDKQDN